MNDIRFDDLARLVTKPSSRRGVVKLLGGGVAGGLAAVAGLRVRGAAAMPAQNTFVRECRDNGGESRSVATRVVRCTHPCAFYTQCNYNYTPPYCFDVLLSC